MVFRLTVSSSWAMSPRRTDSPLWLLPEALALVMPDMLLIPLMLPMELPEEALLIMLLMAEAEEGSISRSRSFSRVMRLSSGDWMDTLTSSPSRVRDRELSVSVRAEATAKYTWATVRPFSMAALRSTDRCRAAAACSRPSDTFSVPGTVASFAARSRAADCICSISSP